MPENKLFVTLLLECVDLLEVMKLGQFDQKSSDKMMRQCIQVIMSVKCRLAKAPLVITLHLDASKQIKQQTDTKQAGNQKSCQA